MHKLSLKLKFCMVIVDMITYAKKIYYVFFVKMFHTIISPRVNILLDVLTLLVHGEIKRTAM